MSRSPHRAALLLAAITVLVSTWTAVALLETVKYPLAVYLKSGGTLSGVPAVAVAALGWPEYLLAIASLVGVGFVLWVELRGGRLSRGLLGADRAGSALLLAALLLWFGQAYLAPGQLITGDTNFHVARIAHFRYGLEQGKWLFWDNYWGLGVPFLQFTGPLLFWLGGALDLLFRDPAFTTKALLLASHLTAGWLFYLLLRGFGLARLAAMVAAVAFVGAWAHGHMIALRGSLPQALSYLLLPLAFLLLERLVRASDKRARYWAGLALVSALLLINHPSTGLYVGVFLVLFVAGNLLVGRYRWSDLPWIVSAGIAGVGATLFMVLPIIVEQDWVTMLGTEQLLSFKALTVERLGWLLVWHNGLTGPGDNFDAYLGLSVLLLAVLGLAALRNRRWQALTLFSLVLLMLSLVLAAPHVRTVMVVSFFLAILAGLGVQQLVERGGGPARWPVAVLLVVMLDLGSTAIQPLARSDKDYFLQAGAYLEQQADAGRLLPSNTYQGRLSIALWGSPLLPYRVQQTSLPHGYSATLFHNYGAVVYKRAEAELRAQGRLSSATEQQLALLNVTTIVNDHGQGFGMPDGVNAVADPVLGRVVRIPAATPVVFAPRLEQLLPEPNHDKPVLWNDSFDAPNTAVQQVEDFVDEVSRRMAYDPGSGFARRLMSRDPVPPAEPADERQAWDVAVTDYRVSVDRVSLAVRSERSGYVRLAHAWYPRLRATRNGHQVPVLRESTGLVILPLQAGDNHFELVPTRSPLRRWLGVSAAVWSAAVLLLAMWLGRSRRRVAAR